MYDLNTIRTAVDSGASRADLDAMGFENFATNKGTETAILAEMLPEIDAQYHAEAERAAKGWMYASKLFGVTLLEPAESMRAHVEARVAQAQSDDMAARNLAGFAYDDAREDGDHSRAARIAADYTLSA